VKVVILSALGNAVAQRCLSSLLETTTLTDFDILLVREQEFRERTLNKAISIIGTYDDILFVGDDIEFTPGWYEALMFNYDKADILGMSMLYPRSSKVQDCGYDLVQVDNRITLEAKDRGVSKEDVKAFGSRRCDALCGCFMLIKKNVFNLVREFKEDGQNRWGEFIFICEARKRGANVAVVDHFLYHGGKSTKSNFNKSLSSISYKMERKIWEVIVKKYVDESFITKKYSCEISAALSKLLTDAKSILFYGAGTVTEHLLKFIKGKQITICSGLKEEYGTMFNGYKIEDYKTALLRKYDLLVMTPLYIGHDLYVKYVSPELKEGQFKIPVSIDLRILNDRYIYDVKYIT